MTEKVDYSKKLLDYEKYLQEFKTNAQRSSLQQSNYGQSSYGSMVASDILYFLKNDIFGLEPMERVRKLKDKLESKIENYKYTNNYSLQHLGVCSEFDVNMLGIAKGLLDHLHEIFPEIKKD